MDPAALTAPADEIADSCACIVCDLDGGRSCILQRRFRSRPVQAVCVDRPKRHLLEVRVKYDGQEAPVRDAFSLERNIRCTREFMRQIANGSVQVSYYKNRYLGISIEGMQIKSEESEIQDIESGGAFKVLSLVIAGPISFVLLARSLRNR